MNTENILCGNHQHVPGDQARVRNYTCSNASLGEKNWHITKWAIAQLKCPQDLREHRLTLTGDLHMIYHGRVQPGHKVSFPHRRQGRVLAPHSQLTEQPKSQTLAHSPDGAMWVWKADCRPNGMLPTAKGAGIACFSLRWKEERLAQCFNHQ